MPGSRTHLERPERSAVVVVAVGRWVCAEVRAEVVTAMGEHVKAEEDVVVREVCYG